MRKKIFSSRLKMGFTFKKKVSSMGCSILILSQAKSSRSLAPISSRDLILLPFEAALCPQPNDIKYRCSEAFQPNIPKTLEVARLRQVSKAPE